MGLMEAMSLAGGMTMAFYGLLCLLFRGQYSLQSRERMLKLAMFFFLCPVQLLKFPLPQKILDWFLPFPWESEESYYLKLENYFSWRTSSGDFILLYRPAFLLTLLLCGVSAVILICRLRSYFHLKDALQKCSEILPESVILAGGRSEKEFSKLKARVEIRKSPAVKTPFTTGFLKPVIYLPEDSYTEKEHSMILLHELVHIQRKDVFFQFLCFLIVLLHWFNPFSWILLIAYRRTAEYRCDEEVVRRMGEDTVRDYAALVVHAAAAASRMPAAYTSSFAGKKKEVYRRVKMMMNVKKTKKTVAVAGMVLALICSTATVNAFNPLESIRKESVEEGTDWIVFEPEGVITEYQDLGILRIDFTESDVVFVDEEGNQYPILLQNAETKASCSHNYISGTWNRHVQNSKGGCTVYVYKGKYCTKCGSKKNGKLENKCTFEICTHKG